MVTCTGIGEAYLPDDTLTRDKTDCRCKSRAGQIKKQSATPRTRRAPGKGFAEERNAFGQLVEFGRERKAEWEEENLEWG